MRNSRSPRSSHSGYPIPLHLHALPPVSEITADSLHFGAFTARRSSGPDSLQILPSRVWVDIIKHNNHPRLLLVLTTSLSQKKMAINMIKSLVSITEQCRNYQNIFAR